LAHLKALKDLEGLDLGQNTGHGRRGGELPA